MESDWRWQRGRNRWWHKSHVKRIGSSPIPPSVWTYWPFFGVCQDPSCVVIFFISVLCKWSHLLQTNPNDSLSSCLSTIPRIKGSTSSSVKASFMHTLKPKMASPSIEFYSGIRFSYLAHKRVYSVLLLDWVRIIWQGGATYFPPFFLLSTLIII